MLIIEIVSENSWKLSHFDKKGIGLFFDLELSSSNCKYLTNINKSKCLNCTWSRKKKNQNEQFNIRTDVLVCSLTLTWPYLGSYRWPTPRSPQAAGPGSRYSSPWQPWSSYRPAVHYMSLLCPRRNYPGLGQMLFKRNINLLPGKY